MELLLVRHALPVRRELVEGPADPELSAEGVSQAEHLATYLSTEHLDAIYASPLRRAYQTAAAVASGRPIGVEIVDEIAEYDRLATHYIPAEELKAANDPRLSAIVDGEWDTDEESATGFRSRVIRAVEAMIDAHPGGRIAVVCHGGVINAYICHVLDLGERRGFFYPNYTSINRVAASRNGERSIITINETSHLRDTGLPMGLFQGQS
jgi:2,3-bisphosphoglycerate-dependent phosphoglycerate mutase